MLLAMNDIITHYFFSDVHVGEFDAQQADVFTGVAGNVLLGACIQMQLCIEAGVVMAARYQVYGDPYTVASAAFVNEQVQGRMVVDCLALAVTDVRAGLSLPSTKTACAIFAIEALRNAIAEYEQDRGENA